jgi:hypothetical protein
LRDRVDTGSVVEKMDVRLERERGRCMSKSPLNGANVSSGGGHDRSVGVPEDVEADRR